MMKERQDIKSLGLEGLRSILSQWAKPPYHARQIFNWIYQRGVFDFKQMTDLSLDLRVLLEKNFYILSLSLKKWNKSNDKTQKFLFKLKDNNLIESVIIPTESRATACISTQAGCRFRCAFCASGLYGFKRNLSAAEIIEQFLFLKNNYSKKITHIVFMGIGEPLDNYENVIKATRSLNAKEGFNIAARRITISTCGLIPEIKKLSQEHLQIELSISLHAPDDKTRNLLMPVDRKYPLKELIQACHEYVRETNRQITFEYVLIKGINSGLPKAKNLVKILKGLNCKLNLIAYNPVGRFRFQAPGKLEALYFLNYLKKSGITVILRQPRGLDIDGGCGQLRLGYEKE